MATPVTLLQLSPTMTEGTLVKWLVSEGDEVQNGQPIAEVETDKAVMEQESFEDGIVLKILSKEGDKIPVESLIMVIGEKGEDISDVLAQAKAAASKPAEKAPAPKKQPAPAPPKAPPPEPTQVPTPAAPVASAPAPAKAEGERVLASPLARKMAVDSNLNLNQVQGTGPNSRIVKRDIEAALAGGGAHVHVPGHFVPHQSNAMPQAPIIEEIPLSGMRSVIARRLSESKQTVPHFQLTVEVRGEKLLQAVSRIREVEPDSKVTVTHFLIKAMAAGAMNHQAIRTQWAGDKLAVIDGAHISVAIAIKDGLVTPVIRNAQSKGVVQIAKDLRELAGLARDRKLTAEDFSGGVQTISNLGMFGIHDFNAIINPPESSILAVSAMEDRPVVENGELIVGKVMNITMSCDHRVIDGAVGAQYLRSLKNLLEEPVLMLL